MKQMKERAGFNETDGLGVRQKVQGKLGRNAAFKEFIFR